MAEETSLQIIGKVAGVDIRSAGKNSDKEKVFVKITESDGNTNEWGAWHIDTFKDLGLRSVHKFRVTLKENTRGNGFFRNLEELLGPAEMPASGEMTSRLDGGSGLQSVGGSTPTVAVPVGLSNKELAIDVALKLYTFGIPTEAMAEVGIELLKAAVRIEKFMETYEAVKDPIEKPERKSQATPNGVAPGANGKFNPTEFWAKVRDLTEGDLDRAREMTDTALGGVAASTYAESKNLTVDGLIEELRETFSTMEQQA